MNKIFFFFLIFPMLLFCEDPVPIAVIGSGPAGLSAALVTGRERIETHVFLGKRPGGPLNAVTCMSNWPAAVKGKGNVVMERLFEQLKRYKVILHDNSVVSVDFSRWPFRLLLDDGEEVLAKSVIIATGARPRFLGVPGEESTQGIETSVYKTDADHFQGKHVIVVGGGIDATKKAKILAKTACRVTVIVRKAEMQKSFMEAQLKAKSNIDILFETEVIQMIRDEGILTHVDIATRKKRKRLAADHVVLAAGIIPNSDLVTGQVMLDDKGYIMLMGRTQMTSVPGVFAAGNVSDPKYRQAAISSGDGMKAAYEALAFLE